ncbi:WD40-repeat-containing domain protein [Lipomyces tetrasporus]|uniref:WD40-repeat-containing domain protein n=1 Tax=Lipomyces tetrasporus TaxID=54092 RepID=A0AAD7QX28_9ASCO|nr:WD40-repeat-containing domain protein [Lipomyces tetrasporus]KAJ8103054.1 WD40-repeat-containing domain protein [Lipomyces tetrasporus]
MNSISTGHQDLIHDIAYDHYGRLLATCSSDQCIKVFTREFPSAEWTLQSSFKAHDANIFSLSFAPPQYGLILASCSEDQTVRVHSSVDNGHTFTKVATLSDSGGPVHHVVFARFGGHGLKLACIGTDGVVRVYHAADPSDLRQWHLAFEKVVDQDRLLSNGVAARDLQGDFAVDWCPSGTVRASGLTYGRGVDMADSELPRLDRLTIAERAVEQFVVSSMSKVIVFRKLDGGIYEYEPAEELAGHTDIVRDVAWASSAGVGGRYELIATACKDGWVRIFKLTPQRTGTRTTESRNGTAGTVNGDNENGVGENNLSYEVELVDQFDDHKSEVWKVSWNFSGTVLSSSGDDGRVRFWRAAYTGKFIALGVASAEQGSNDEMED